MGGEPAGDMRELLEEQLGVVVTVDRFDSLDLRAASIVDAGRVSAAAVLSGIDDARVQNPLLARVYLAHELSHILFDPGAPNKVQIALDNHPQGSRTHSLLESRARGFAAELLLPAQGLLDLFGQKTEPEPSYEAAREMVSRAVERFKTPWEIATWHLKNLRFIAGGLVGEILQTASRPSPTATTTLPDPGDRPLCFKLMPDLGAGMGSLDASELLDVIGHVRRTLASEALEEAYAKIAQKLPLEATDLLFAHLDALLSANELARVRAVLEMLDPTRIPPEVITPILTLTSHAKETLGADWTVFFSRVMATLESPWGVSEERRKRLTERLA